jgi:predicted ferric reductase
MATNFYFTEPRTRVRLGERKRLRAARALDTLQAVAWLAVIAVVAMFLMDGAVTAITDVASGLNALSRLTALVGTALLLIHMLLVARVPWIDQVLGLDKATAAHKKLGKPIMYVIAVHFLASLTQFALLDGKNLWDEFIAMNLSSKDLLLGSVGFVLMVIVVVSSINIARRKLSYEAWYVVHMLSYIAVLVAIPHQFSTGSDIAGKPVQTVFWVVLYLFVAGNIVWFRFLSPVINSFYFGLKVRATVAESSDSVSIYITGRNLKNLGGEAGQFYIVRMLTAKQWWRAHPFSISAAPNDKFVRFTVGNRGDDTALLQHIKPGTRVILEGPYGVFTEERRSREKVTLIAAGIGAPPIRALAESMAARPGDISIIYRVREEADAPLVDELRELSKRRGFNLTILEGRRGSPTSWMPAHPENHPDHARLATIAPYISESDVFICGPAGWTHTVAKSLKRAGTPENQIHAEEFAW